ncbi:hypothetical protein GCM10027051_14960 [Niabella terrae]
MDNLPEVWLRGQHTSGLSPVLQSVADALLQAGEEINALMPDFSDALLWVKPGGVASAGFHLLHIPGVLDRLLSYAEEKSLTEAQLAYLRNETLPQDLTTKELVKQLSEAITQSIHRMKRFTGDLIAPRAVGRSRLPSTIIGLCTHAAEHTMRHAGQLLVTVKILNQTPATLWN